ncbi:MAG: hypothetical protein JSS49_29045 [Planctomycetes bacterium]|nr:hypothetical protein [Planctomycetota bacterium]
MKSWRMNTVSATRSRTGAILVFAMIALLVVSMIGAAMLSMAVASMRQIQREHQQLQAGWLLDSGCQRALTRLRLQPDYTGEDWNVSAEQLQTDLNGLVRITVTPDPSVPTQQLVSVIAEYPQDATQPIRARKTFARPKPEAK